MSRYYYLPILEKYITVTGEMFTEDQIDYIEQMEREWKKSLPNYTFKEIMDIFRKHGIELWPDGRALEKVIVSN